MFKTSQVINIYPGGKVLIDGISSSQVDICGSLELNFGKVGHSGPGWAKSQNVSLELQLRSCFKTASQIAKERWFMPGPGLISSVAKPSQICAEKYSVSIALLVAKFSVGYPKGNIFIQYIKTPGIG